MQENWKFKNTARLSLEGLVSFLESHSQEFGIFLSYYVRSKGATAENIRLINSPVFKSPDSGYFSVEFDVAYFNLCLGIDDREKEKMKISFHFDEEITELQLIGEDWQTFA
ncbi:hypothetical protein ACFOSV_13290 [Algoriphagus namhaensis]|uniref:Uncharacterized protein n=1 Tax=Algoriphagus namhaensis TaxID=915353 RepID=A0ABV8AW52_9BACT